MCFKGTCNTETFNTWIEKVLILVPGQLWIMPLSITTKNLIENSSCKLLFLPPYSPDLNPKFWAWLKAKIKTFIENSKSLPDAIDLVFKM